MYRKSTTICIPVQKFMSLYWDTYCCTVVYMYFILLKKKCSRTTDEYVCSGVYVLSERLIFFCTGAVICVLRIGDIFPYWSLYFCTEINISVLGYILLY